MIIVNIVRIDHSKQLKQDGGLSVLKTVLSNFYRLRLRLKYLIYWIHFSQDGLAFFLPILVSIFSFAFEIKDAIRDNA